MPPEVIGGAIAGVGAIASAVIGSKGAKKAAKIQAGGAEASIAEQRRQFDISLELGAPRREAENEALNALRGLLGLGGEAPDVSAFAETPGFQFTRDEALQAVERQAAARGGVVSGNTLAALQNRAAGLAGQNFLSSFLDPITQLATGGAGGQAGREAQQFGFNIGQTIQTGAAARASGILGSTGAITGGLSNLNQAIQGTISNVLLQKLLNPAPELGTFASNPANLFSQVAR
jgi:hypothetical protein